MKASIQKEINKNNMRPIKKIQDFLTKVIC